MDIPTVAALLTVVGLAPIVTMLTQLVWRTTGHDGTGDQVRQRFGPIVAVALGIGLSELALSATAIAGITRLDIVQSALTGMVGGFAAIGLHDVVSTRAGMS